MNSQHNNVKETIEEFSVASIKEDCTTSRYASKSSNQSQLKHEEQCAKGKAICCSSRTGKSETDIPAEILVQNNKNDFEKGDRVEARFRGRSKKWYPGIVASCSDNTYDIDYDDGDKDTCIRAEHIRLPSPPKPEPQVVMIEERHVIDPDDTDMEHGSKIENSFKAGDVVEAKYRGRGRLFYTGVVSDALPDGTFNVDYHNGGRDRHLRADAIRLMNNSNKSNIHVLTTPSNEGTLISSPFISNSGIRMATKQFLQMNVGTKVEALYRGKTFFPGRISRVNADGTFDIAYDNGRKKLSVPLQFIRYPTCDSKIAPDDDKPLNFSKDDTVDINYEDGNKDSTFIRETKKSGTGEKTRTDTGHDVGDHETLQSNGSSFKKGDRVEAKSLGRGDRYYKAIISSILPNGSYNIRYDDGVSSLNVPTRAIRAIRGSKSKAFIEGVKVEVKTIQQNANCRPGVIRKARPSGTFDISYENGDMEARVRPDLMKLIEDETNTQERSADSFESCELDLIDHKDKAASALGECGRSHKEESQDSLHDAKVTEEENSLEDKTNNTLHPRIEGTASPENNITSQQHVNYWSGKGNLLYRGVVSKVKCIYLYDIKYPDGSKDVNIPFEALSKQGQEDLNESEIQVGTMVDVLSWQSQILPRRHQ